MLNAYILKPATMRKISILLFIFSFTIPAASQQKLNPVIGKNEFEISLSLFNDAGIQIVHRWSWKERTKIGVGGLVEIYDAEFGTDVQIEGALFGDINQFIGKRQKWSVGAQIGHGIFNRELKNEDANYKLVTKHTAGMYYSISVSYRAIITKKLLIVISPGYNFRNYRMKVTEEIYSPPSNWEYKSTNGYGELGIKLGIVF